MIDFNFDYYKPSSVEEALMLFQNLKKAEKKPLYYNGGTEIITFAGKNDLYTGAVIDIKGIPEANALYANGDEIVIGAGVTLTSIEEAACFPLLTESLSFPADHTARNKITLGGNICGRIIYKEAVLVPLILDAKAVIAGRKGIRTEQINKIFNKKLLLNEGEFLIQVIIDKKYGNLPYYVVRRTRSGRVGYPILSLAAIKKDNDIRFAVSGVCSFPFRSKEMEEKINRPLLPFEKRVEETIKHLPGEILSNVESGIEYREFILKNTLIMTLKKLNINYGERLV